MPYVQATVKSITATLRASWLAAAKPCFACLTKFLSEINSGTRKELTDAEKEEFEGLRKAMHSGAVPTDVLASFLEQEKMADIVQDYNEIRNAAEVLGLTFSKLVEGSWDMSSDENMDVLASILQNPSRIKKDMAEFRAFQAAADDRMMFMAKQHLMNILQPLLKPLGAQQLLGFMTGKCDTSPFGEAAGDCTACDSDKIAEASKACAHASKTLLASWLHKDLPDFAFAVASATCDQVMEGGAEEQPLEQVCVKVWMACGFPVSLKVLASVMRCSKLRALIEGTEQFELAKLDEFVKQIAASHADLIDFKSTMATMELRTDDAEGAKVYFLNKFAGLATDQMSKALAAVLQKFYDASAAIHETLDEHAKDATINSIEEMVNEGCGDDRRSKLLEVAQSRASKHLHISVKSVEGFAELFGPMAALEELKDVFASPMVILQKAKLLYARDAVSDAKRLNCILASVQGLFRPLKADETRGKLARRVRAMAATKQCRLPPNLDMLVTKLAAAPDQKP